MIIQTYRPDHYAVRAAVSQDYKAFYEEEIGYRSMLMYPPKGHMLAIMTESGDEDACVSFALSLAQVIRDGIIGRASVIGPAQATIGKIRDIYRQMIYVKSADIDVITRIKDDSEAFFEEQKADNVRISFDLDPMNGY